MATGAVLTAVHHTSGFRVRYTVLVLFVYIVIVSGAWCGGGAGVALDL